LVHHSPLRKSLRSIFPFAGVSRTAKNWGVKKNAEEGGTFLAKRHLAYCDVLVRAADSRKVEYLDCAAVWDLIFLMFSIKHRPDSHRWSGIGRRRRLAHPTKTNPRAQAEKRETLVRVGIWRFL
jgi:hypothetical protein